MMSYCAAGSAVWKPRPPPLLMSRAPRFDVKMRTVF
jgi:hypothetical protein